MMPVIETATLQAGIVNRALCDVVDELRQIDSLGNDPATTALEKGAIRHQLDTRIDHHMSVARAAFDKFTIALKR